MKKLFLVLVMLSPVTTMGEAATRYVSPSGSGITCSDDIPCGLIQGLSFTEAGDTLYLKAGVYSIRSSLTDPIPSGLSSSQPTILAGKPGDIAILRPTTNVRAIRFSKQGRSNIVFRNFVIDGVNQGTTTLLDGITINNGVVVNGLIVEDMEIKNISGSAIQVGSDVKNSVFRRNRLHDLTGAQTRTLQGGHCIYLRGSDNVVEHNECYNTWATGITMRTDTSANRNIIRYNTFRKNAANREVTNGGRAINCSSVDNIIHNNTIILSDENGITATLGCKNVKIYNNTIYNNRGHGINMMWNASGEIKNNIIYLNGGSAIANVSVGVWTISNNFTTDPLFVGPNDNNFSLKAGSPAIGKGATVNALENIGSKTDRPLSFSESEATVQD